MPLTYSVLRWKSVHTDCKIARVSMCDERGGELFVVIEDNKGPKVFRERLDEAVDMLCEAIESGRDPGEVECRSIT